MNESSIHRDNHYVPRLYLKRWGAGRDRISTYRLLVSHPQVPLWKMSSIRGVAYREHLYTRIVAGRESDDVEKWLDREFEAPAEEPIHKAVTGARLSPADWRRLVRFLASQDVRTPARFVENLARWSKTLPELIESTLQASVRRLELAKESGTQVIQQDMPGQDYLPFRVTTESDPESEMVKLQGEAIAGRGMWLFSIRHLLTRTVDVLCRHSWTILSPPDDLTWFTSDDPVVRLNWYGPNSYDFQGGWGNPGTDIFLPLGPRHLLFTTVGRNPPQRGTVVSDTIARELRRFMAEHAHRTIFADMPDPEVPLLRPRTVDAVALRNENEQWKRWHHEQSSAERELMG